MDYRLFVASTVTGDIVADIPWVGLPRWEYRLNSAGSLTATVPVEAMDMADFDELTSSWRWSWGWAWGSHILQAGPVITDRCNDVAGPVTAEVGCGGLWSLFMRRVLIDPLWIEGQNVALTDRNFSLKTLKQIAKEMILGDLIRAGHSLPIVLPADDAASTHARSYPGYDLAFVGERLSQLTQVIDGPEVEFRPRFVDETQRKIEWEMRVGDPRLGQMGYPHVWDYGRALQAVDYDRDGSSQSFGHFERGDGSERGLLTAYQDDKAKVNLAQYPWPDLETTRSAESGTVDLQAKADGYVATHGRAIVDWSATVRMDGTDGQGQQTASPSVDTVRAGDTATFRMDGHRRIKPGSYGRRIIGASSGPSLDSINLALQPTLDGVQ